MSILDDVMLKQIEYIVLTEHRPFSYLDFCSEKVKDQPYFMTHGTYRNKISMFMKLGIVEPEYNAGTSIPYSDWSSFWKEEEDDDTYR